MFKKILLLLFAWRVGFLAIGVYLHETLVHKHSVMHQSFKWHKVYDALLIHPTS